MLKKVVASKVFAPIVLICVAIVSHAQWFSPSSVLTHSDWYYWPTIPSKELWLSWGTWLNFWNSGTPNIQLPYIVFNSAWSLLAHFGVSFDIAAKLTFLIPIALLGFLGPYYLVCKLINNRLAAFGSALFYGSTTYFLVKQTAHLPIALIYAALPVLLLLFMRALNRNQLRDWLWFAIAFTIGIGYEVRIMLIVCLVMALSFFLLQGRHISKRAVLLLGITGVAIIGLNLYWILPTLFNSKAVGAVADRGLFGDFLFNIQHALTLHESSWTGSLPNESFKPQPIPWFFWLYPLLAILPFTLLKHLNTKEKKLAVFFGVLSILGIFLTKQSAAPFPKSYAWLYGNFPGFMLFREASKFYMLTALGYMGLIALLLVIMQRLASKHGNRGFYFNYIYYVPLVVVAVLVGINLKPLIFNQFGTMFISRQKPRDYTIIDKFISTQPNFFRTYWLPTYSRWSIFDNRHPEISAIAELNGEWHSIVSYDDHDTKWPLSESLTDNLAQPYSQAFFSHASVKYIFVPLKDTANDDDFFKNYAVDRRYYIEKLNATPWLYRLNIGTKDVAVYENVDYHPHFTTEANPVSIDAMSNSHLVSQFTSSTSVTNPIFTDDNHAPDAFSRVQAVFGGENALTDSFQSHSNVIAQLFKREGANNLYYSTTNNTLTIYQSPINGVSVDRQKPVMSPPPISQILKTIPMTNLSYVIDFNGTYLPVRRGETAFIGATVPNANIDVYTLKENLIQNGSFEKGLWQPRVEDCNNYGPKGLIAMSLNATNSKDGAVALKLSAVRHVACTHTSFVVKGKASYIFQFSYQSDNAKQAGYYIQFDDKQKTTLKDTLTIPNKSWQTITKKITTPADAKSATLYLYSYESDHHTSNDVNYDNVSAYDQTRQARITLSTDHPHFIAVPLQLSEGNHKLTYAGTEYNTQNLIRNSSFEKGFWQPRVEDCDNYDSRPNIGQKLNIRDRTDGRTSLELWAVRHTACTTMLVHLPLRGAYMLDFDYRGLKKGGLAGYNVTYNDSNHTTYYDHLPANGMTWAHESKRINAPADATAAYIVLYAYESDGISKNTIRYDNVKLQKAPDIAADYFLMTDAKLRLRPPRSLVYQFINPTKYTARAIGVDMPFVLNFAESFDPGWHLYLKPLETPSICNQTSIYKAGQLGEVKECQMKPAYMQKNDINMATAPTIFDKSHIKMDGYANGWLIDPAYIKQHYSSKYYHQNPDGSMDMNLVVYFKPQSYFYMGLVISGLTLVGIVGSLAFISWRNHKGTRPTPYKAISGYKKPLQKPSGRLRGR